ncbi:MAG: nitrogenase iron-molybdenum cofactor biosynthesis protein NifE, partial [Methanoregula sp.]
MDDLCALRTAGTAACISEREQSIITAGRNKTSIACTTDSLAGSVSQRACVFCGARVVLNPVT